MSMIGHDLRHLRAVETCIEGLGTRLWCQKVAKSSECTVKVVFLVFSVPVRKRISGAWLLGQSDLSGGQPPNDSQGACDGHWGHPRPHNDLWSALGSCLLCFHTVSKFNFSTFKAEIACLFQFASGYDAFWAHAMLSTV